MKYFKQCQLTRGETSQVAYIYEQYAKLGKILKIKDEDGWVISRVGEMRIGEDYLKKYPASLYEYGRERFLQS